MCAVVGIITTKEILIRRWRKAKRNARSTVPLNSNITIEQFLHTVSTSDVTLGFWAPGNKARVFAFMHDLAFSYFANVLAYTPCGFSTIGFSS